MKYPKIATGLFLACQLAAASAQPNTAAGNLKSATETARKIQEATGAKPAAGKVPPGDPCAMLSEAEVRKAFPKARAGVRSSGLEQHGIAVCTWSDSGGAQLLGLQTLYDSYGAAGAAREMTAGLVDPFKRKADIRIEAFPGVGGDAAGFVEKTDEKRGVLSTMAFVAANRNGKQVRLLSSDLALRDRAEAIKTLEELGRAAAKRLE